MAVQLHQPSVYALFEAMPVPLLTLGVSGLVTYANNAAKQHPGRPVESMSGKPVIKALVADAILGKLKLPYSAEVELADGNRMIGKFMAGPAGLDIAFLAQGAPEQSTRSTPQSGRMGLTQIVELLRDEVGPPMRNFSAQLKALPPSPLGSTLEHAENELGNRLDRLSDLLKVFGDDVLASDDRIELLPLLKSVCRGLAPQSDKLGVRFEILELHESLPPIYGNEKLIRRALHECLDNALVHSRQEMNVRSTLTVEIRFTLSGEHILLSVRNKGAAVLKYSGREPLLPFTPTTVGATEEPLTRLGLPLVQRIVGLHGGNMRLSTGHDDTVQVLLEFPTGAPRRGAAQLGVAQAQIYAKDLARLMSRRHKEKA